MGATNCPETPRQRMIGMMYLVLTALLALNVSVEIINSFLIVNESMEITNKNFSSKNDGTYAMFRQAYLQNKEKVGPNWEKAQQAQKLSKEMIDYVNGLKFEMMRQTEGLATIAEAQKLTLADIKRKDNYDTPTTFFIGQSETGKGAKAEELKNRIIKYKNDMKALLDPKDRDKINLGLEVEKDYKDKDGKKQNWEMHNFYHTIVVATITILNKINAEILNAEYDVVNQLYSAVDEGKFTFDVIEAKVIPTSNYVLLGEQYQAEIFVGAFDTKSTISANINGATIQGDSGLVMYKAAASSEGLKKYTGVINVKTPFGVRTYPFENEYIVAKPSATVSADKMNVFYIGVENPVTVSVPGVPNEKVKPTIAGGTMRSIGGGKYIVNVTQNGKATITINADFDGKTKTMAKSEFRVKRVPSPIPQIGGISEGFIEKNKLAVSGGIVAKLIDFDFDLQMVVTSFTMQTYKKGELSNKLFSKSNKFTPDMISLINQGSRGQKFWFENITAKAPDGNRALPSVTLTIK